MNNPRKSPIETNDLAYGQHAAGLGPQALGKILAKCLSEINLIISLPPGPQATGVAKILRLNLQKIAGLTGPGEDD